MSSIFSNSGVKSLNTNKEEKLWGTSSAIYFGDSLSACHISIKKGGFCSNHRHERKWNQIYVVSGLISVQIYKDDRSTVESVYYIGPGQALTMRPGINHKFQAMEDTEALELYFASVSDEDIVREDTGGMS